jgi:2-polyprenyl-3-methyl-5-hydroxy-6-metoxy-1,4-benzoquinol methylase
MLKIMHGKNLKKRYSFIADQIEENDFVLDLGCGTGLLADYLKAKRYLGMDVNKDFVRFAKSKGHDVVNSDIFEFEKYPGSVDVVVLVDMLHHITPQEEVLMKRLAEMDLKKIIVSESIPTIQRGSFFYRVARFIYRVFDDDGHNEMKTRLERFQVSRAGIEDMLRDSIKRRFDLMSKTFGCNLVMVIKLI